MKNREIKFRCWNIGNRFAKRMFSWEEMIDTLQTEINPNKSLFAPFIQSDQFKENPWIILMQYTGLHDKNGKEIYEEDIVKEENESGTFLYKIEWDEYDCCFFPKAVNSKTSIELRMSSNYTEFEVIGNIYENPNLLKQ